MLTDSLLRRALSEVGNSNNEELFIFFDTENNDTLTSKDNDGNVKTYESSDSSVSHLDVVVTGDEEGTLLTGVASGGLAPYTYAWTKMQNQNIPFDGTAVQSATTPAAAATAITVASNDAAGSAQMWKLTVTDANGAKAKDFWMNVVDGTIG